MVIVVRRPIQLWALGLGWGVLSACGVLSDPLPMTAERCQAQPGFIFIAAGTVIVGSDRAERDYGYRISAEAIGDTPTAVSQAAIRLRQRGWFEGERQRQQVDVAAYCMAQTPVTQADYQQFVAATGHPSPGISEAAYQEQGFLVHPYEAVKPYLWSENGPSPTLAEHPVVLVSHEDAVAYAAWRGGQDGVTYRLPTDLEWEKAARGDDGRYFPWGSQWQADATNWGGNEPEGTSAVGAFPRSTSPFGVEEMAGNVFEFTSTRSSDGSEVVMKGCSWDDWPGFCRAAYRHTRPVQSRHILFGFRLVME